MRGAMGLLLLVLGVVAFCLWPHGTVAAPAASAAAADDTDARAAPAAPAGAAASTAPSVARREVPPSPASEALATLRGRCVDAAGKPLAGVLANLSGFGGNPRRLQAWVKTHPTPESTEDQRTTGADGLFAFHFAALPPFQYQLRLTGVGVATMEGGWGEVQPDATIDLGDVTMMRGTLLSGRVVDGDGAPVTKGEISFRLPTSGGGDALHAQDWASESVRSDGSFRCRWALQVGTYTVDVAKRKIERPQQVTIAGDRDEQLVDVVVAKIDAADAISGIVVDDRDQPVSGAMVFYSPMPDGHGYVNSTDRDGHFQISRPDHGTADEVTLSLFREDYDAIPSTTKYAWGRSDVRLVMRGGLDVELTVVDGDNKPVEIFRARVVPMYTAGGTFGREYPGASGTHAGGHAVIHRITRGSQLVTVEPPAESPLAQACVVVDVADPGPALVGVQLSRRAERTLRLQRADGSAVVGAAVQLADPLGQPFTTQTPCYPLEDWSRTSAAKALQLQTAVTDAQGETLLSGPGGRALALLLPGPKHVPTTIADVHLDEATPLVVTVITGARVTGRVGPAAALVELRRLAELPLTGALPARTRQAQPGIVLARGEGTSAEVFPDRMSSMPIDADGSFAFDGAPPGRWQVSVAFAVAHSSSGMMSMSIGNREPGPVVDLSDGATTDVAIDLSSILPGELDGVVLRNGKPLANTAVRAGTKFAVAVTTDADGRFHATLRAGECELTWPRGQPPNWSSLRAAETINIVTGQTVAQTFHLDSGTVRVRVLDPHGNPAAKVRIELRDAAGTPRQSLPPTGDDGSTTAEIEAETLAASALPKRLQEWPAQQAYWVANPGNPDPLASQRLQLGSITARAGDTIEVELRLPADWER